jgi:hypothetical protein
MQSTRTPNMYLSSFPTLILTLTSLGRWFLPFMEARVHGQRFRSSEHVSGMLVSPLHVGYTIDNGRQTLCFWGYQSGTSVSPQHLTQIPLEVTCLATIINSVSPMKGRNQHLTQIPPEQNILSRWCPSIALKVFELQVHVSFHHVCLKTKTVAGQPSSMRTKSDGSS